MSKCVFINWGDYEQMQSQQFIRADIAAKALEDPGIMAIFETCDEHEYLEQMMLLAISRKAEYDGMMARLRRLKARIGGTLNDLKNQVNDEID